MKKIIIIILIILLTKYSNAQSSDTTCGTLDMDTTEFFAQPWVGNNKLLNDFLDSVGYNDQSRLLEKPRVWWWIPIKLRVYRRADGTGGPNLRQTQAMIDNLNRIYNVENDTKIGFYLKCDPEFLNSDLHFDKSFVGANLLMTTNRTLGCINVHVVNSIGVASGIGLMPMNACIVDRSAWGRNFNLLAHEIGHVLGLVHTHLYKAWQWKCLSEAIDRNRTWPTFNLCFTRLKSNVVCEATGDGLSDTNADPNLQFNTTSCNFNAGGQDPWGDFYSFPPNGVTEIPDTRNVMSYQRNNRNGVNCNVDRFSKMQIGVMLYRLFYLSGVNSIQWRDDDYLFDSFEPDYHPDIARQILVSVPQVHNFNLSSNRFPDIPSNCDQDWVIYRPLCNGLQEVRTFGINGKPNANTRLTIYAADQFTILAQNDNISPTDLFSSIIFNFLTGQEYFIRVDNMSPGATTYYNLLIGQNLSNLQLDGIDLICNSSGYTILDFNTLPFGTTVQWAASPANMVNFSSLNTPNTNITRVGNGSVTISALITIPCGIENYVVSKTIYVGTPTASNGYITLGENQYFDGDNNVPLQVMFPYLASFNDYNNWGNYTWSLSSNLLAPYGTTGQEISITPLNPAYQYFSIAVQPSNACGLGAGVTISGQTVPLGGGMEFLRLAPNPTVGPIEVSIENNNGKAVANGRDKIKKLFVVNKFGTIVKQFNYGNGQKKAILQLNDLPADVYGIRVYNGSNWMVTKFIKQ